ncbi:hypothetical protein ABZ069_36645 [Streptomyces microflavus]|uniref:hypothetical protein n=1 Tax=Streptomyces microflavus TaxID=1919 RepID=UPI0033BC1D8B
MLKGLGTLVLVSSDGPDARMLLHHRNVAAAAAGRVCHVVALSGVDADTASTFCYAVVNGLTEDLLQASAVPHSFARTSPYVEFFQGRLTEARPTGLLRLPAADGQISLVTRDEVAPTSATTLCSSVTSSLRAVVTEPTDSCSSAAPFHRADAPSR